MDRTKLRWRLMLGQTTQDLLDSVGDEWQDREAAIGFLYDREQQGRNVRSDHDQNRHGSLDPSNLNVPDWINAIHELFPKKTIERLEKDSLERYQLAEIVTNPEVLGRVQPSATLLKAVLRTKHLLTSFLPRLAAEGREDG